MGQRYDWIFMLGHSVGQGHEGSKWAYMASRWKFNRLSQVRAPALWPPQTQGSWWGGSLVVLSLSSLQMIDVLLRMSET